MVDQDELVPIHHPVMGFGAVVTAHRRPWPSRDSLLLLGLLIPRSALVQLFVSVCTESGVREPFLPTCGTILNPRKFVRRWWRYILGVNGIGVVWGLWVVYSKLVSKS